MVWNSSYCVFCLFFFLTIISITILFPYKKSLYTSSSLSLPVLRSPQVQHGESGHCVDNDQVIKQNGCLEAWGQKEERGWAVWLSPFHYANISFTTHPPNGNTLSHNRTLTFCLLKLFLNHPHPSYLLNLLVNAGTSCFFALRKQNDPSIPQIHSCTIIKAKQVFLLNACLQVILWQVAMLPQFVH